MFFLHLENHTCNGFLSDFSAKSNLRYVRNNVPHLMLRRFCTGNLLRSAPHPFENLWLQKNRNQHDDWRMLEASTTSLCSNSFQSSSSTAGRKCADASSKEGELRLPSGKLRIAYIVSRKYGVSLEGRWWCRCLANPPPPIHHSHWEMSHQRCSECLIYSYIR